MTRETKVGLVVASSFICLVGVVVASKMRHGDLSASPSTNAGDKVAASDNPFADKKKPKDGKPDLLPTNLTTPVGNVPLPGVDTPPPPMLQLPGVTSSGDIKLPAVPNFDDKKTTDALKNLVKNTTDTVNDQVAALATAAQPSPPPPAPEASLPGGKDPAPLPPPGEEKKPDAPLPGASTFKKPSETAPPPSALLPGAPKPAAPPPMIPPPGSPPGSPPPPSDGAPPPFAAPMPMPKPPGDALPPPAPFGDAKPKPETPFPTADNKPPVPPPSAPTTPGAVPPPGSPPPGSPPGTPPPLANPKPDDVGNPFATKPTAAPPLGANVPAPPIGSSPGFTTSPVKSYDVEAYTLRPEDTSFAAVSQRLYNTDKYALALQEFNRGYPLAGKGVQQNPPRLEAGQKVFIPPSSQLESSYPTLIGKGSIGAANPGPLSFNASPPAAAPQPPIRNGTPPPIGSTPPPIGAPTFQPAASSGPAPMGSASAPAAPTGFAPSVPLGSASTAAVSTPTAPTLNVRTPAAPSTDSTRRYKVREGGQHIIEIARQTLGDGARWGEIYRLNPTIPPQFPIPGGTEISLPANAVVP